MGIKRDSLYLLFIYAIIGILLVFIVVSFQQLLSLRRHVQQEQTLFSNNVLEQTTSLYRVIFAINNLILYEADSETREESIPEEVELCRQVLGHARISPHLDSVVVEYFLQDDPLLLKQRYPVSVQTYKEKVALLSEIYERLNQAETAEEKINLLRTYREESIRFLQNLKDYSSIMTQLEGSSHSHLKYEYSHLIGQINIFLLSFIFVNLLLGMLIFLFFRARRKIENELREHKVSLEVLVETRTAELCDSNRQLTLEGQTRKQAEVELEHTVTELEQALKEVKPLSDFLPIRSVCKKIRDDKGYWHQVEEYVHTHVDVTFSHGICPDCMKIHYSEYINSE